MVLNGLFSVFFKYFIAINIKNKTNQKFCLKSYSVNGRPTAITMAPTC